MKNEILKDYLVNGKIDMDKMLDDFYGYVYIIVKNTVSISITDEDIEEIISDVFLAIWRNSKNLSDTIVLKSYLTGTAKNVIKNKYRKTELNFSISEYEETLVDSSNLEKKSEEDEQNNIIKDTLKTLKQEDYNINESDFNKIKALDVIGGAIDIQYNSNSMATEDLLIE